MNKKINKKKIKIAAIILMIGLLFVPILYSGIYLTSIWDAYGKIDKVPVAFVNSDKPYLRDGKVYNLGEELEKSLKNNDKVDWKFVDIQDAKKGVEGTKYYALIQIPEDFSKKISDSQNANIIYTANKGKNFVFSQISAKVADSIKTEISSSIQEEMVKTLDNGLLEIKTSLEKAADGTTSLSVGINKLLAGSQKISASLTTATEGTNKLSSGLEELKNGEQSITNGAGNIIQGLTTFKTSLDQPNTQLATMLSSLYSLDSNASKLKQSSELLSGGIDAIITQTSGGLDQGTTIIGDNVKKIESLDISGMSQNDQDTLRTALATIEATNSNIKNNISTPLKNRVGILQPLVDGLTSLKAGTSQIASGGSELVTALTSKQTEADTGLTKLIGGASQLQNGSITLTSGLDLAGNSSKTLSLGLGQLAQGAQKLNTGLETATNGVYRLDNGLNSGVSQLNGKLKVSPDELKTFAKSPVQISDKSVNVINYYGEGLAPYFISLSLWIGAMLINLFLSLAKKISFLNNKFLNTFGMKYLSGIIFVGIQSLILSFILTNFIGLSPVTMVGFYLINLFISIVFFSFMYGISEALGIGGTALIFVMLILQLASAGGTFPIETAPVFFRTIGNYLPMTYCVSVLRFIISGINSVLLQQDIFKLSIFMIGALLLGGASKLLIYTYQKNRLIKNVNN